MSNQEYYNGAHPPQQSGPYGYDQNQHPPQHDQYNNQQGYEAYHPQSVSFRSILSFLAHLPLTQSTGLSSSAAS